MVRIRKIHEYFMQLNVIKFIVYISILTYLVVVPYVVIISFFTDNIGESKVLSSNNLIEIIFVSLIFAPIVETFIYQTIIIQGLRLFTWFRSQPFIVASISALLFGVSHSYSIYYIIFAFLIGLLLAYSYLVYLYRKESSFWVTVAIHFIRNSAMTFIILLERIN